MPDIKTAMSAALLRAPNPVVQKTIDAWDDEGEAGFPINISSVGPEVKPETNRRGPPIRNNVMRETFTFIMQNPGLTCKTIAMSMARKGFKEGSVTSVVSQLWRTGQLIKDGESYRTKNSTYTPVSASPTAKVNKLKKQVETLRAVAKSKGIQDLPVQQPVQEDTGGIASLAAPPAQATPLDPNAHMQTFVRATDILKHMSVYQARELYAELKKMFGG